MDTIDVTPFIEPASRDRVTVTGPDAGTYLQSQLAQDISSLGVGAVAWTLVLDPSGKIDALARISRIADDSYELDTDAGFGAGLAARLARFKIRVAADIEEAAAPAPASSAEAEAARVAVGWPRMGAEIVPGETIPATTGLVAVAVSLTKGCYPGQELVERMDSRGAEAPRSLRIVEAVPGSSPGDVVVDEAGAEVGTITSVSPTGELALAYVKRGADVGRLPAHAV